MMVFSTNRSNIMRSYIDQRYHWCWYGVLDGEDLPVGHDTCCRDSNFTRYIDKGCREPIGTPINPKWRNWINTVRNKKRIIIQVSVETKELHPDGTPIVECVDYVGLFAVSNVKLEEIDGKRVLSFDLKVIRWL
jgi:hypothetical protein